MVHNRGMRLIEVQDKVDIIEKWDNFLAFAALRFRVSAVGLLGDSKKKEGL